MSPHVDDIEASSAPLVEHLMELRTRLIYALIGFFVAFVGCFVFADQLFNILTLPAYRGGDWAGIPRDELVFIYTAPQEYLFTQLKLAMFGGFFLAFPVIATQIYLFVAPGLYRNERGAFLPFLVATPILFLIGACLVYFFMMPMAMWFFASMQQPAIDEARARIDLLPRVSEYLSLIMTLIFAFGMVFQLPVVTSLLGARGDDRRRDVGDAAQVRHRHRLPDRRLPHAARSDQPDQPCPADPASLRDRHSGRPAHRARAGGARGRRERLTGQRPTGRRSLGRAHVGRRQPSGTMHDIRAIRDDPAAFDEAMRARGGGASSSDLIALDDARRTAIAAAQDRQQRRNALSKEIGAAMKAGDAERADAIKAEVAELKAAGDEDAKAAEAALTGRLAELPNVPLPGVPVGPDESANEELRRWGEPPAIDAPKQHFELGEALGLMSFDDAALVAGARFTVLTGALARLERALGQFMVDRALENGHTEVSPPLLVRDVALYGTGQLPKFAEDLFKTTDDRYLVPTAEVPLTNLVRERILDADALPRRLTALTPCFRSEAGSAGRDTRGMLRQHQFLKCEMVSIVDDESGEAELDRMTRCAEGVLEALGLPYRTVVLSTGDMGFSARRTHDIEVWMPGQGTYREISSCSFCGDFQARRMNARYRGSDGKPRFVHTLNGSGVAVGRALIAVMENYQSPDGTIRVPQVLTRYMGGTTVIGAA